MIEIFNHGGISILLVLKKELIW